MVSDEEGLNSAVNRAIVNPNAILTGVRENVLKVSSLNLGAPLIF